MRDKALRAQFRCAAVLAALAGTMAAMPALARDSALSGRWTMADEGRKVSANGEAYREIDIASCGEGYCVVSVGPTGGCGATLIHQTRAPGAGTSGDFFGRARWGSRHLNAGVEETDRGVHLTIGNFWQREFVSRSGSMAAFEANYRRNGDAQCHAR